MQILGQDRNLKFIDHAIENNLSTLLIGETGSGKTTMVQEKAKEHGKKAIRFNLTGETTVDEFVGKHVLRENPRSKKVETLWEDGVLLQAMKKGHWLIVDEINAALPEILMVLHPLLDDDKAVLVANNQCEVVEAHPDFRFFATMNPEEEYTGTKTLNKAFKSRFQVILKVEYPENTIEDQILQFREGIAPSLSFQMVSIANFIRKMKEDGQVYFTFSTRDLIQWARLSKSLDVHDAFEISILNKANGDGVKILETYKKVMTEFREIERDKPTYSPENLLKGFALLETEKQGLKKQKKEIQEQAVAEMLATLTKQGSKDEGGGV